MGKKYDFSYLIEKLKSVGFDESPFKHVYIDDFFQIFTSAISDLIKKFQPQMLTMTMN